MNRAPSWLTRTLMLVGGVLAALSLVVGHVNREILDGPRFAEHVDDIRQDPEVSAALGTKLSNQIVLANPDLVALRPLVESVSIRVAGSDLLSGPTKLAARSVHQSLAEGDSGALILRIADAAAIVAASLNVLAPGAPVDASISVTLASVGSQELAADVLALVEFVSVLVWLLPLLALICFVVAVVTARRRWAAAAAGGRALIWAAGAVGVLLLIGGWLVRRVDDQELAGALVQATWAVVVRPMWWGVVVVAVAGATVALTCDSDAPERLARQAVAARRRLARRPTTVAGLFGRALAAAILGVLAITDPLGTVEVAVVAGGVGLLLYAITEIAAIGSTARARAAQDEAVAGRPPRRSRAVRFVVLGVVGLLLVGAVAVVAQPGRDIEASELGLGVGEVCNGHAELCDRTFDEVAYVATHNSMAVAREPGWFLAEQVDPIRVQLDQGVRALLIDVWSGIPAGEVVRTAPGSYPEALAIAIEEVGPAIVDAALRVADSVAGQAVGPEARYLCHALCETGSTPLLDVLDDLRAWMAANPDEVVTLFIEDHVDAALIAEDIAAAGLLDSIHQPVAGEPWPTLGEMIRSGRRLVVMVETGDGGETAPWLVNGFEFTQETPYTFPTVESFSCEPNRGPDDAPLFQLNHWLSGFSSLVTDAELVNTREVLLDRARQCQEERGQIPNFVAVNFVVIGDVFDVVDELNGVA